MAFFRVLWMPGYPHNDCQIVFGFNAQNLMARGLRATRSNRQLRPKIRFNKVDLPTLGRPTMAT